VAIVGSLIRLRSIDADTIGSITSGRRGLGQTAIPRIDNGLIIIGLGVKAEPGLVGIPPNGISGANSILAGAALSIRDGRRSRSSSGWWWCNSST